MVIIDDSTPYCYIVLNLKDLDTHQYLDFHSSPHTIDHYNESRKIRQQNISTGSLLETIHSLNIVYSQNHIVQHLLIKLFL